MSFWAVAMSSDTVLAVITSLLSSAKASVGCEIIAGRISSWYGEAVRRVYFISGLTVLLAFGATRALSSKGLILCRRHVIDILSSCRRIVRACPSSGGWAAFITYLVSLIW